MSTGTIHRYQINFGLLEDLSCELKYLEDVLAEIMDAIRFFQEQNSEQVAGFCAKLDRELSEIRKELADKQASLEAANALLSAYLRDAQDLIQPKNANALTAFSPENIQDSLFHSEGLQGFCNDKFFSIRLRDWPDPCPPNEVMRDRDLQTYQVLDELLNKKVPLYYREMNRELERMHKIYDKHLLEFVEVDRLYHSKVHSLLEVYKGN